MTGRWALLLALAVAVASTARGAELPAGVSLPLTVFDVDWSDQEVGQTPQRADKAWLEGVARDPWRTLPWRSYTQLDFVTRDRTALVREAGLGLKEQPIVFTAPDGRQPHWGPRMTFSIPHAIGAVGRRYRVSLEVSMLNVTRMGGIALMGVGEITFSEDGSMHFGKTEIGRYQPSTPIRVEVLIDVPERHCEVRLDDGAAVAIPWHTAGSTRFVGLRLDGLLPGGHARAPGALAFDNIRIILEE